MSIVNASSNVEWNGIQITHLGTTSPTTLTLDVGTFTGDLCRFSRCGTTIFSSSQTCTNTSWENSGQITHGGATLNGSSVSGYTGAANTSAVLYNIAADPDGEMDDMQFTMGATATHAIEFGLTSPTSITLRDCVFNGYNATGTNAQNDSIFHIKRTTGTVTINLVGCSTDASGFSYRTDGATVVLVQDPVTTTITVIDAVTKLALSGVRVLVEAGTGGPLTAGDDIIFGTTDGSGQISDTRTFASNQPVTGRARLSTTPGSLYINADIVGTINSVTGLNVTVQMIPDE